MNPDQSPMKLGQPPQILELIDRMARDPNVDIGKMERFIALQERMHDRHAKSEYDAALSAAQAEMRPISRDCHNPQTRSRYASYEAIDAAIRPIYTNHGFGMSFGAKASPNPLSVIVTCRVAHRAGHTEHLEIEMPADGKGAQGNSVMTRTHATGSALSYGKRYLANLVWNLSFGESDDDGNAASPPVQRTRPAPEQPPPAADRFYRESAPPKQPDLAFLRSRMLGKLMDRFGAGLLAEYIAFTHGTEWPLAEVPTTKSGYEAIEKSVEEFQFGKQGLAPEPEKKVSPIGNTIETSKPLDKEWFWSSAITLPRAGMKREEYAKNPDTIQSLYDGMKAGDAKSRARLWGVAKEWHPEPRIIDGNEVPPSAEDLTCRKALDAFLAWHEGKE